VFQLIFQGSPGTPDGALAIDDIVFGPGCKHSSAPLPTWPVTKAACRSDQFTCSIDNKCIPANRKCDAVADCSDADDEKGCSCTNYCLNGGRCYLDSSQLRKCNCYNGYSGPRCKVVPTTKPAPVITKAPVTTKAPATKPVVQPSGTPGPVTVTHKAQAQTSSNSSDGWKPAVGVVVPLVLIAIICAAAYTYLRRTKKIDAINWTSIRARLPGSAFNRMNRGDNDNNEDGGLNNPIYDYGSAGGAPAFPMQDIEPPKLEEQDEKYSSITVKKGSKKGKAKDQVMSLENPIYHEEDAEA
jgi:hypothetical protein